GLGLKGIEQSDPRAGFPDEESWRIDLPRCVAAPTPPDQRRRPAEAVVQVGWHCDWAARDHSPEKRIPTFQSIEKPEHEETNPARRGRRKRSVPRRRR